MTRQQWIEQTAERCRNEWFKEHEAREFKGHNVAWLNPRRSTYACFFILHENYLTVVGDIGEAVYAWSNPLTTTWLAGLEFDYFHGKCVASEVGRKFTMFVPQVAYATTLQAIKPARDVIKGLGPNSSKEDYDYAARKLFDKTGDAELASALASCGEVPHVRCIGHWVGIKMAHEALTRKEVVAA